MNALKYTIGVNPIALFILTLSRTLVLLCAFASCSIAFCARASDPPVQLAQVYANEALGSYLVSKKYDGFRAIWKNKQLSTRNGHPINAPQWFTARYGLAVSESR